MLVASLIIFTPIAICLMLLALCAAKRAQCQRLTSRWRGIGGCSLLFAALYAPVVFFFLSGLAEHHQ